MKIIIFMVFILFIVSCDEKEIKITTSTTIVDSYTFSRLKKAKIVIQPFPNEWNSKTEILISDELSKEEKSCIKFTKNENGKDIFTMECKDIEISVSQSGRILVNIEDNNGVFLSSLEQVKEEIDLRFKRMLKISTSKIDKNNTFVLTKSNFKVGNKISVKKVKTTKNFFWFSFDMALPFNHLFFDIEKMTQEGKFVGVNTPFIADYKIKDFQINDKPTDIKEIIKKEQDCYLARECNKCNNNESCWDFDKEKGCKIYTNKCSRRPAPIKECFNSNKPINIKLCTATQIENSLSKIENIDECVCKLNGKDVSCDNDKKGEILCKTDATYKCFNYDGEIDCNFKEDPKITCINLLGKEQNESLCYDNNGKEVTHDDDWNSLKYNNTNTNLEPFCKDVNGTKINCNDKVCKNGKKKNCINVSIEKRYPIKAKLYSENEKKPVVSSILITNKEAMKEVTQNGDYIFKYQKGSIYLTGYNLDKLCEKNICDGVIKIVYKVKPSEYDDNPIYYINYNGNISLKKINPKINDNIKDGMKDKKIPWVLQNRYPFYKACKTYNDDMSQCNSIEGTGSISEPGVTIDELLKNEVEKIIFKDNSCKADNCNRIIYQK